MAKQPFYSVLVKDTKLDIVETYGVFSFAYEESNEKDNQLTLQIRNQNLEMIDENWLVQGTELLFLFGYKGQEQSQTKIALITEIDINYSKDISITIKAVDKGNYLKKSTSNKVWEEMTAAEIVSEIADFYDMESAITATKKLYETLPQGNLSDFDLCKKLAQENNFHFHISNNKLYFDQRKLGDKSQVTYTYRNGDSKIKSFKPKNAGIKNNTFGTGAKVEKINTDTNEVLTVKVDANKVENNTSTGKIKANWDTNGKFKGKTNNDNLITNPSNDKEVIKNQANKTVGDAQLGNIEATLTLEGEPQIIEGMIITMAGVAQKHIGNYYVVGVKHSISNSGYETIVELKKNATNKPITNNATKTSETVNNSTGTKNVNDKTEVKTVNYTQNGTQK